MLAVARAKKPPAVPATPSLPAPVQALACIGVITKKIWLGELKQCQAWLRLPRGLQVSALSFTLPVVALPVLLRFKLAMERQNSERPRHGRRDSRTHQSARLSAPLTSSPGTAVPARPEPVAASPPRDTQTKRHRAILSGPRSILHQSATCSNELCDDPEIPTDGRLCRGPEGLDLCIRCYKRFKIERRRAREEHRDMTEAWRRPKRSRSNLPTASPTTLETARDAYTSKPHRKHSDQPSGGRVARASRRVDSYAEKPPLYEPEDKSTKQPSPHVTSLSQSEKSESLHNFPTSSVQEYGRLNSQSPRKHRSQREKAERRHSHYSQTRNASAHDEGRFHKHSQWGEDGDGYSSRRSCCGGWSRRRKCVIFGTAVTSTVLLVLIIALAVTLSRKDKFNYKPSFAQVNSSLAFESGGGTRKNVNDTDDGIGAGTDTYVYYQGNASNFPRVNGSHSRTCGITITIHSNIRVAG